MKKLAIMLALAISLSGCSGGYSGGLTVMVNENGQPLIWKGESNG